MEKCVCISAMNYIALPVPYFICNTFIVVEINALLTVKFVTFDYFSCHTYLLLYSVSTDSAIQRTI